MKKKIFTFVIVLLAAYILLAATDIEKEVIFQPRWVTDLTRAEIEDYSGETPVFPFRLGGLFGYLDSDGKLVHVDRVLHNAALGENWFLNFSNSPGNLIARDTTGSILFNIEAAGYPFIREGRLFIVSPEGNGISEWDKEGNMLWERWFGSVITSFDLSATHLLVGMLKGVVELIDQEGKTLVEYVPENSRIAAIYGCGVTESGDRIAVLSGIDPQRLTVLDRRDDEYKIAISTIMDTEFRRTVFLAFSGRYLFIEGDNSILFLEPTRKWIRSIPIQGRLHSLTLQRDGNLFYIVTEERGRSWLQVGLLPGHVLYKTVLPGTNLFSTGTADSFCLGNDYTIMQFDLVEN